MRADLFTVRRPPAADLLQLNIRKSIHDLMVPPASSESFERPRSRLTVKRRRDGVADGRSGRSSSFIPDLQIRRSTFLQKNPQSDVHASVRKKHSVSSSGVNDPVARRSARDAGRSAPFPSLAGPLLLPPAPQADTGDFTSYASIRRVSRGQTEEPSALVRLPITSTLFGDIDGQET